MDAACNAAAAAAETETESSWRADLAQACPDYSKWRRRKPSSQAAGAIFSRKWLFARQEGTSF